MGQPPGRRPSGGVAGCDHVADAVNGDAETDAGTGHGAVHVGVGHRPGRRPPGGIGGGDHVAGDVDRDTEADAGTRHA